MEFDDGELVEAAGVYEFEVVSAEVDEVEVEASDV